jgi:hypothetical protein
MSSRRRKPIKDDYPPPWESRPISKERWQRHRTTLMERAFEGHRPEEWWLYERNMDQPDNQAATLYAMGELQGIELEKVLSNWRMHYEAGNKWVGIPREIVKQWDDERKHHAQSKRRAVKASDGSGG